MTSQALISGFINFITRVISGLRNILTAQVILGINLTRHLSRNNLRINSERQKWPLRKASYRWQKWRFLCIGCILPWTYLHQSIQNCFETVTRDIFGQVEFSAHYFEFSANLLTAPCSQFSTQTKFSLFSSKESM